MLMRSLPADIRLRPWRESAMDCRRSEMDIRRAMIEPRLLVESRRPSDIGTSRLPSDFCRPSLGTIEAFLFDILSNVSYEFIRLCSETLPWLPEAWTEIKYSGIFFLCGTMEHDSSITFNLEIHKYIVHMHTTLLMANALWSDNKFSVIFLNI